MLVVHILSLDLLDLLVSVGFHLDLLVYILVREEPLELLDCLDLVDLLVSLDLVLQLYLDLLDRYRTESLILELMVFLLQGSSVQFFLLLRI